MNRRGFFGRIGAVIAAAFSVSITSKRPKSLLPLWAYDTRNWKQARGDRYRIVDGKEQHERALTDDEVRELLEQNTLSLKQRARIDEETIARLAAFESQQRLNAYQQAFTNHLISLR